MATALGTVAEKSPPGRLYFQVVPEAQRLKQLLCDGFIRSVTSLMLPPEIINICKIYYDEVRHWNIDQQELEPYLSTYTELETDIFRIDDIQMKCSLHPNKTDQDTVFYVYVFIPKGVERIMIYSELYCTENDAHFRYVVPYVSELADDWHFYEYVMYLKCKDFESINLNYYVEILSITYDDGQCVSLKPIKMKKKLSFTWDFDESMVQKFRKAAARQMFLSETFDEYNNNWGLWIIPMDYDLHTDKKKVQLALTLYKRPPEIFEVSLNYKLETSHRKIVKESSVSFGDNVTFEYLEHLFESEDLEEINTFSVTLHMEITSLNSVSRDVEDFFGFFGDIFNE